MNELDKSVLLETLEAFERNDRNYAATGRELGIARSTVQQRVHRAAETGLAGAPQAKAPPGFLVKKVTRNQDEDGKVLSEWVHLFPEAQTVDEINNAIEEAMKDRPALPTVEKWSTFVDTVYSQFDTADLATIYPLVDHHLGLYSWEAETGANYDLTIAQNILRDSLTSLVAGTPASTHAVILNVGDFFHSDDNTNRTRRSGNVLDADGRYAKILEIGIDLEIFAIELALTKHDTVEVRNLPGNHDPYASLALNAAIRMAFRNNPRVHISRDPSPFYFFRWGKVLVGSTHGDMIKATDMPAVMASYAAKDWGETEHRYIYLGHVHHASKGGGERFGAVWETFRTLAAKDAWATQSGYSSGRSMVAITHHKDFGEVDRKTVTIAGPGYKKRS